MHNDSRRRKQCSIPGGKGGYHPRVRGDLRSPESIKATAMIDAWRRQHMLVLTRRRSRRLRAKRLSLGVAARFTRCRKTKQGRTPITALNQLPVAQRSPPPTPTRLPSTTSDWSFADRSRSCTCPICYAVQDLSASCSTHPTKKMLC